MRGSSLILLFIAVLIGFAGVGMKNGMITKISAGLIAFCLLSFTIIWFAGFWPRSATHYEVEAVERQYWAFWKNITCTGEEQGMDQQGAADPLHPAGQVGQDQHVGEQIKRSSDEEDPRRFQDGSLLHVHRLMLLRGRSGSDRARCGSERRGAKSGGRSGSRG